MEILIFLNSLANMSVLKLSNFGATNSRYFAVTCDKYDNHMNLLLSFVIHFISDSRKLPNPTCLLLR